MHIQESQFGLTRRVIDSLYVEAMVLADEARSYFDQVSREDRDQLDPVLRVAFSCESLKVTTRLMHVIAWLLTRRAVASGEMDPLSALSPSLRLGQAVASDPVLVAKLAVEARTLIDAIAELYARVQRLDIRLEQAAVHLLPSPARGLHQQLERAF
jgi:regulator of CtrA degradation